MYFLYLGKLSTRDVGADVSPNDDAGLRNGVGSNVISSTPLQRDQQYEMIDKYSFIQLKDDFVF